MRVCTCCYRGSSTTAHHAASNSAQHLAISQASFLSFPLSQSSQWDGQTWRTFCKSHCTKTSDIYILMFVVKRRNLWFWVVSALRPPLVTGTACGLSTLKHRPTLTTRTCVRAVFLLWSTMWNSISATPKIYSVTNPNVRFNIPVNKSQVTSTALVLTTKLTTSQQLR